MFSPWCPHKYQEEFQREVSTNILSMMITSTQVLEVRLCRLRPKWCGYDIRSGLSCVTYRLLVLFVSWLWMFHVFYTFPLTVFHFYSTVGKVGFNVFRARMSYRRNERISTSNSSSPQREVRQDKTTIDSVCRALITLVGSADIFCWVFDAIAVICIGNVTKYIV